MQENGPERGTQLSVTNCATVSPRSTHSEMTSEANSAERIKNMKTMPSEQMDGNIVDHAVHVNGNTVDHAVHVNGNTVDHAVHVNGNIVDHAVHVNGNSVDHAIHINGNIVDHAVHVNGNVANHAVHVNGNIVDHAVHVNENIVDHAVHVNGYIGDHAVNVNGNIVEHAVHVNGSTADHSVETIASSKEEVVISGISGRFPESGNMEEFAQNLYSGTDMITESDARWPAGWNGLPRRSGKLKEVDKFDAQFFNIVPKQAHNMEPGVRILLELVHETILDAGYDPQALRGSRTGVFVGCSVSETHMTLAQNVKSAVGYVLTGCVKAMFANRISFAFNFQGPSLAVDTACSSSLLALQLAADSIREGNCDAAIVAGVHLTLSAVGTMMFNDLGMLSADGMSRPFDDNGQGYVRSETVCSILLQKSTNARRCYATVVHAKSNTDGYKEAGIMVPSGLRQQQLLEETYREAGIDPAMVDYVEAHGTGTKVGDPEETYAIAEVMCRSRHEPLLIGSVKSNMGHPEPASGLASVAKVLLAFERNVIPPNLNYVEPNAYIPALVDGRLKVVTEPTQCTPQYVGINSFGFGGANTHVLLRASRHSAEPHKTLQGPRLVCYSGRTFEGVELMLNKALEHAKNASFHGLLAEQSNMNINQCPHRGYVLMNRNADKPAIMKIQNVSKAVKKDLSGSKQPIWFIYSGMGSQWAGMAREIMRIETFHQAILRCSNALRTFGVDPYLLIMKGDEQTFSNVLNAMVCVTAIQIALTDTLKLVGIEPDGFIGHSTGETACAYADGCFTREQTMLCAYYRAKYIMDQKLNVDGGMAAVGLTWDEVNKRVPPGVVAACHNAHDSVTVSGQYRQVEAFVRQLNDEGVFAKMVNSAGVAFHSPQLKVIEHKLLAKLQQVVKQNKRRTNRWISSSIPESEWECDLAKTCSPEYQVNNAMSPVLFHAAISKVPSNAITIEIAPHALLAAILRRSLAPTCTNLGLMKRSADDELEHFLVTLGAIHQMGVDVRPDAIFGQVQYPVPRGTPMISPLIRWDHSQSWFVLNHEHVWKEKTTTCFALEPFSVDSPDNYLLDHIIDGRKLFPFTGYVVLAWRAVAEFIGRPIEEVPIVVEELAVLQPTFLSKTMSFYVTVAPRTGQFEITDGSALLSQGVIRSPNDAANDQLGAILHEHTRARGCGNITHTEHLDANDIYRELILRGFDYGAQFRGIHSFDVEAQTGNITWSGNWVTFLDACMQTWTMADTMNTVRVPTKLRYLHIDPQKHLKSFVTLDDRTTVISLTANPEMRAVVAGGVEMCDLQSRMVQRRTQTNGKLFFNRTVHLPYMDSQCLKLSNDVREQLIVYRQQLERQLITLASKWNPDKFPLRKLPNGNKIDEVLAEFRGRKVEQSLTPSPTFEQPLSNLYNELLTWAELSLDEINFRLTALRAEKHILNSDKFYGSGLCSFAFEPHILDVMANTPGRSFTAGFIEPLDDSLISCVAKIEARQPNYSIKYNVIGQNASSNVPSHVMSSHNIEEHELDMNDADTPQVLACDCVFVDGRLGRYKDISLLLKRLMKLVEPSGFIVLLVRTSDYELTAVADWLFMNEQQINRDDTREHDLYFTRDEIMQYCDSVGLLVISERSDPFSSVTTYLLRQPQAETHADTTINVDDVIQFSWLEPTKDAIEQSQKRDKDQPTSLVWLISEKISTNGLRGLTKCLQAEDKATLRVRSVGNAALDGVDSAKMNLNETEMLILKRKSMETNLWRNNEWGGLYPMTLEADDLVTERITEHAYLDTVARGDLASFKWIESSNKYHMVQPEETNNALVTVYAVALNFRDVMLGTGKITPDIVPGDWHKMESLYGSDWAGRTPDGNRVFGMNLVGALATTLRSTLRSFPVPEGWTFEEACSVCTPYSTAYLALLVDGDLQPGESVLIHSGAGGVGQAAITVALSMNCTVFTTVGSRAKREYLMQRFPQLTEQSFSNSRTTEFENHIMNATKGQGVDIVLNSLADDKLQLNTGILLDGLLNRPDQARFKRLTALFNEGIKNGVIQPIPATVFGPDQVESAFRHLVTGEHVGKVVVRIRAEEEPIGSSVVRPSPCQIRALYKVLCHPQHVYLITGGLGGFGLQLADWLIKRGARKLVLTSRSGVRNGYQRRCLQRFAAEGAEVRLSTLDISESKQCDRLVDECLSMGKAIGGVFHLAMVLRDAIFENQIVENFKETAKMKYWGTQNLDAATRHKCEKELNWFVVFSSTTAAYGNEGQTCYGWANSAMERIIEQRRHDCLAGMAIQWGPIGDVGVLMDNKGTNETLINNLLPQRIPSCLQCLDTFFSWNEPIVGCFVRADLATLANEKQKGGVIETIANIMGVSDVDQLDLDASLMNLGIDSLLGVEIQQVLERNFNIVLSMKDIKETTLRQLKNRTETGGTENAEGEKTIMTAEVVERRATQLFNIRLTWSDFNNRMLEDLVCLNQGKPGQPVFFVHGIEGLANVYSTIAPHIDAPVYGLQWTPRTAQDSLQQVAEYYVKVLHERHPLPNGVKGYRIVGYSYGATIAFLMGSVLQGQHQLDSLCLIDGSHQYMSMYRDFYRDAYGHSGDYPIRNNPQFETDIITELGVRLSMDFQQLRTDLQSLSSWEEKLSVFVGKLKKQKMLADENQLQLWKSFVEGHRNRFACAADLSQVTGKLQHDVTLIRALKQSNMDQHGRDYGLNEVVDGKVIVHDINGDHDSLVNGEKMEETAKILNEILRK